MDDACMTEQNRNRQPSAAVLSGPARSQTPCMLRRRNMAWCCVFTTSLASNALAQKANALAFVSPAAPVCVVESTQQQPRGEDERINTSQAADGFARARLWVTNFDAPRMDAPESQVPVANASGVCVILRRHGRVMGIGTDDGGDDLMLRRAVGRAMNEVLSDPALQSVASAIRRDSGAGGIGVAGSRPDDRPDQQAEARLETLRRDLGRSLTLELEVAGPRTPLVGATLEAMAAKIEPGIDGMSLRHQQEWAHAFPSQLRAANLASDPAKTLSSLAMSAGVSLADLGQGSMPADSGYYKFTSIDLAQGSPDAAPVELLRGERVVPIAAVTREGIASMANGLAQHLLRGRFPTAPEGQTPMPLGFMGDYNPVADQFSPLVAPPLEQALCALALTRFAQLPDAKAESAKAAASAARQAMRDLAEQAPGEEPPLDDQQACAAIIMVVCEMPSCMGDASIATMARQAYARLTAALEAGHEGAQPLTSLMRAMIGCACARVMLAKVESLVPASPDGLRGFLDHAWESAPEQQRVGLLPWLGWAERDVAAATRQPLAHAEEMKRLIEALQRARIEDAPGTPLDLIGGLTLTGSTGGEAASHGRATSQSARPVAWLASVGSEPALTAADQRATLLAGHLQTLRFLRQLAVSDIRSATCRNPARAVGGICAAPWDSRQPLAAQAITLLAIAESLQNWPKTP